MAELFVVGEDRKVCEPCQRDLSTHGEMCKEGSEETDDTLYFSRALPILCTPAPRQTMIENFPEAMKA